MSGVMHLWTVCGIGDPVDMRKFSTFVIAVILFVVMMLGSSGRAFALDDHEAHAKSLAAYAVGVMYDLYGQTDLAIEEFKKASQYSDHYAIRLRLGADYARLGELSLAIQDLQKVLEFDPGNVQARYLLALIYSTQKDYDRAAQEYENILTSFVEAEPENVEIYGYLAHLYYSQKQYDKAIQQFEAVLSLDPQNTEVIFLLGALYLELGDEDNAVDFFKRTLKLEPQHDAGLNSLGYIYADRGENLDQAQKFIERALEIDPNNGAYLDSLGWLYFKKGEKEIAITYLFKAASELDDPVIYEHLGDVYFDMGNFDDAKSYWNKSLKLKPKQEHIIQKIQGLDLPKETLSTP